MPSPHELKKPARHGTIENDVACPATWPSTSSLPPSAQAPALARRFARRHLCRHHAEEAEAAVLLLTSELVTHALLATTGPIAVTVTCEISQVRILVTGSGGSGEPAPGASDLSLLLVDKVSRQWGKDTRNGVETWWCTVPTGVLPPRQRRTGTVSAEALVASPPQHDSHRGRERVVAEDPGQDAVSQGQLPLTC